MPRVRYIQKNPMFKSASIGSIKNSTTKEMNLSRIQGLVFNDKSKKVPNYYCRPGPGSYFPD